MHRRTTVLASGAVALGLALSLALSSAPTSAAPPKPKPPAANRVLIVLFDQMVPQYADQFAMPNFRKLRSQGTNFSNAYLGYMASETVMAHNVITSGLQPQNMGWTDEAYRDTGNLFGKGADAMHITGDLSLDDFVTLEKDSNRVAYPKLADYLHSTYPGSKFITVGEKSYAVESATGATGDIAVRMSSRRTVIDPITQQPKPGLCTNLAIPGTTGNLNYREPAGKAVPDYISTPKCGRFFVNSDKANDYGTHQSFPAWMYQGEGNRFVPGNDPAHLGGDTWVADAAIQMMERENWSGMFVTMGGIDKAGHMWGAQDDAANARPNCATLTGQTHVKCAAENADVQLGKLLAEVKKVDQARGGKTLVVLTADHGATYGRSFYGKQTIDAGDSNWYYAPPDLGVFDAGSLATGTSAPDVKTYSNPSTAVKNILDADGHLAFSYQSTAIEAWLRPQFNDEAGRIAKAQTMLTMPGVTAAYYRDGDHFTLQGTNAMTTSERSWWQAKAQDIVDTMAAPDGNGPDVIGLLHDNTSYGVYGDHGGAQESVQRVPMVFWVPGLGAVRNTGTFRTPDVMPTILQALGIPLTTPVDGTARPLG